MALETAIRSEYLIGLAGDPAHSGGPAFDATYTNDNPRAKQVDTVTIDTASNAEAYSIFIDGVELTYTSDASATTAEIAQGLADLVNASRLINGRVLATISDPDLILTARVAGRGFTTTEGDNAAKMTLVNTTANAVADTVAFGLALLANGLSATNNKLAKLAKAGNLTAQVDNLLLVYDATVLAKVDIRYYDPTVGDFVTRSFEHAMATDADTSVIAMVALINAQMPANTVLASHPTGDTLTLTSEVAGQPFEVSYGFGTGADTGTWTHTTNRSEATDVNAGFVGVSMRDRTQEVEDGATDAVYKAGSAMQVREQGAMHVAIEAALSTGNENVYVRLVASGTLTALGGFTPTPGAGVVLLKNARWLRPGDSGRAILQLR